nr:hypothetical protein [Nanoarchaeum sp.]
MAFQSLADSIERFFWEKSEKVRLYEALKKMENNQPSLCRDSILTRYYTFKTGIDYLTNRPKLEQVMNPECIYALELYATNLVGLNF